MQATRPQLSVQLSVLLATVCAVSLLVGGAAGADEVPSPAVEYVVVPGDTLWDIASRHVPEHSDVRPMVAAIRARSGLTSSALQPGQVLSIPSS